VLVEGDADVLGDVEPLGDVDAVDGDEPPLVEGGDSDGELHAARTSTPATAAVARTTDALTRPGCHTAGVRQGIRAWGRESSPGGSLPR